MHLCDNLFKQELVSSVRMLKESRQKTFFPPNCLISALVHKKNNCKHSSLKCLEDLKISRQKKASGAEPY